MRHERWLCIGLALGLTVVAGRAAQAQVDDDDDAALSPMGRVSAAPRGSRAPLKTDALEKLRKLLVDADQVTALTAIQALADSGASNAARPLIELLAVGTQPAVAMAAADALKKLRDPAAVEVLLLYAHHRDAQVRRHTLNALGVFTDPRVVPMLTERLGDAVPEVRTAAAEALATRGEKSAWSRMLALFKRNDAAVAASVGVMAPVSAIGDLMELQGGISDDNLATALGEMLKRRDVAESNRLELVKSLAGLPGPGATTALIEYIGSLPSGDKRGSKAAAQKAVDARSKAR